MSDNPDESHPTSGVTEVVIHESGNSDTGPPVMNHSASGKSLDESMISISSHGTVLEDLCESWAKDRNRFILKISNMIDLYTVNVQQLKRKLHGLADPVKETMSKRISKIQMYISFIEDHALPAEEDEPMKEKHIELFSKLSELENEYTVMTH